MLLLLFEELLDHEREVVADEAGAVHQQQAADNARRDQEQEDRGAHAEGVREEVGEDAPAETADENDVHDAHCYAQPAQAVGTHGLQHGRHHRERARGQDRLGNPPDHEHRNAVGRHLQRREQSRRKDQEADEHECLRRVLPVGAVEVATDRIEDRHCSPPGEAENESAMQDVRDVQRVVQVKHLERTQREHTEAERGERCDRRPNGRDLLQPREGGFHRRLRRVLVLDDLAEHVLLLVLSARRFAQGESRESEERARDPEHEECPPPAFDPARPRGDRAHGDRAEVPEDLLSDIHHRRHPGADTDWIVVGEQRLVHGDVVGLGHAGQAQRPEEYERAAGETGEEGEERGHQAGDRDDRHAPHPVGEEAHRDGPERVEEARSRGDEHDRAIADVEGLPQLGLDRLHGIERELVERYEQPEYDEHPSAALGKGVPEVHRFGIDAGQQVVREDHLLLGPGLRLLAGCLLVENGRRERRGAAFGFASCLQIGHGLSRSPAARSPAARDAGGWSDGTS